MIALYKGKSWLSKAIRWQTRGEYSHAAWLCPDGAVYEAWSRGGVVRSKDLSEIHTPGTEIDLFSVIVDGADVEMFLQDQVGKKYDFRSVTGFMTRRPELPQDQDKWFCSELIFAAIAFAGVMLLHRVAPFEVSPKMISWSPRLYYQRTIYA